MDRAAAQALIERTLKLSRAAETEVTLGGGRMAVTRFADNHIHQNVEEAWPHVSVRVGSRIAGRWHTGRAETTDLSADALKACVDRAAEVARLSQPDANYVPMVYPDEAGTWASDLSQAWHAQTAASGPAVRASMVAEVVLPARRRGVSASGQLVVADGSLGDYGDPGVLAIGNSRGLFHLHRTTAAQLSCTVQHPSGSTGWAEADAHALGDLKAAEVYETAVKKAELSANPTRLDPGPYTVVLEPAAVASLLGFLLPGFARQRLDEGQSAVGELLGERAFPIKLSLADDPFNPLLLARPFDAEGVATRTLELIRTGVVKGFAYTRREALKYKIAPTGHSPALPSAEPASLRAPVLTGGTGSVEELIRSTPRGLLITRLWYNRFVDLRSATVTGMTRDGLLRIEDGKLVGGAVNMRYNVSVLDLLRRVESMSTPVRAGHMVVPGLKVEGFTMTGTTEF